MEEFELKIDFTPDSRRPSRVFSSMGDLIDSIDQLDSSFLSSLGFDVSAELLLHDIEKGSLKSILRWVLQLPDKESLREGNWKKVLGRAVDDARDYFLTKLEDQPKIESTKQVKDIQQGLLSIAEGIDSPYLLNAPAPISLPHILATIKKLESSTRTLDEGDEAFYHSERRKRKITKSITISEEVEEELLSKTQIQHPTKAVLPVKKPDYIGDSQWDLILAGKVIHARILHESWLEKFHRQEVRINPGDAIEAFLEIVMLEDYTGKVVGYRYSVTEVVRVIERKKLKQLELEERKDEGEQDGGYNSG